MKCLDCKNDEGTLLKEFDNEKNYSWYDLSKMTEVCASCGSENIKTESEVINETVPYNDILEANKGVK